MGLLVFYKIGLEDFPTEIEFSQNGGSDAVAVQISDSCLVEIIGGGVFTSYCFDQATGEATAYVETFGGTPPYTVTYNGPTTMGTINVSNEGEQMAIPGLPAGIYTFEARDANNILIGQDTLDITGDSGAIVIGLDAEPPICPGGNEGFVEIATTSGGVGPYSYRWNTGAIQVTSLYDLPDGNYSVTVTDSKGCSATETVSFVTPPFF